MRRYEPLLKIASGGTATVYVGAATGALGFRQLVAIKQPHAHLADDPTFRAALLEEAKIAARIRHANVVDVRDVEVDDEGIQLVMDWVEGASLSDLIRSWSREPPARAHAVALRAVLDACEGLHAVHELAGDDGLALGVVHRDVSPANVLVGIDGVARIADFGLAKPLAVVERTTSEGALRGKLGYMAPEYVRGKAIDRRVDVFAMGVVLWESLTRKRLFRGENDVETLDKVQRMDAPSLAVAAPLLGAATADLDAVLARALAKEPDARFATVAALVAELERVTRAHDLVATHGEVRDSFGAELRSEIDARRARVQQRLSEPPSAVTTGRPRAPASEPPPTARRRRWLAPLAGLVTVAGVGGIAIYLALAKKPYPTAPVPSTELATTSASPAPSPDPIAVAAATPSAPTVTIAPTATTAVPARAGTRSTHGGAKPPRPNPYPH
ncbi:MAG: serine/threonine protein kinase [Myxococcaceae bacterium]|nr:serine/threonine protein kinase [Myxococcaceae bacterium]